MTREITVFGHAHGATVLVGRVIELSVADVEMLEWLMSGPTHALHDVGDLPERLAGTPLAPRRVSERWWLPAWPWLNRTIGWQIPKVHMRVRVKAR